MNDTSSYESQPRVPGVRYVKETRFRQETTTIAGVSSTRSVPYEVDVPVPPKDWDEVILRGVTGLAVGITGLAVIGTTASVGGQLGEILHPVISYGVGVVFTATWLACLGLEWVARTDPKRATPARIVGWITLVISMGAVFSYGYDHGQAIAGGVGACLDLLAKGLWALLIHTHRVPLSAGVSHWLHEQEEQVASRSLLSRRIARLNRNAAYQKAVGGREYQAAGAILTSSEPASALSAPDVSGQASVPVSAPTPVPVVPQPPVRPPSGQPVQPVSVQAQAPVPVVQQPTSPVSGHGVPVVSGQVQAPSGVVPQAFITSGPGAGEMVFGTPPPGSEESGPNVALFGASKAATIRNALEHDDSISNEALTDLVRAAHGDSKDLSETVRRTRIRQEEKLGLRKRTG